MTTDMAVQLDLGYLGLFLGLRVNELVLADGLRAGFDGLRQSHGYVIQHLIEQDRSISELAGRMGVSQQAASKVVTELRRLGVVDVSTAADRRQKRVALSPRGWAAVRRSRAARRRFEQRLIREVGIQRYEDARAIVKRCLEVLGGLEAVQRRRVRLPG